MKSSFVLYTDYLEHIELLDMERRGILLTAIMTYVDNGEVPEMDGMTAMAFSFIKSQIDRDKEKYESTMAKRKEAGQKGGRPKAKKANGFSEKAKKANGFLEKQKNPVNDNDNENDNGINIKPLLATTSSATRLDYPYQAVVDYLNLKAGTSYRHTTEDTRKLIRARFNEKFTLEQFQTVIDKKVDEWKGTDMEKFLRPKTLFGNNFESYLNQNVGNEKKPKQVNFPQRDYDIEDLEQKLLGGQ